MEAVVQTLCEQHAVKGVKSEVLVSNTSCRTVSETINGIPVTRVASMFRLNSVSICPTMPIWLRGKKYDIITIHHPNPMADISYLYAKPRGKLVVVHHSDIIKQKFAFRLYRRTLNKVLRRADVIIATAQNNITYSHTLQPFADKCRVVPLGINVGTYSETEAIRQGAAAIKRTYGENLVLFVGRLVYYKGIDFLIRAAKTINGKLLIVGTGPLEKKMRRLASALGVADRVIFLGRVESLTDLYYAADVFVLPSVARSEAFGVVQLEAMACGTPIVSTDLPSGVPEVNRDGVTGIVVPPGDEDALASAVNKLLADESLRRLYGDNGREIVAREHTQEVMAERFYKIYSELMADK